MRFETIIFMQLLLGILSFVFFFFTTSRNIKLPESQPLEQYQRRHLKKVTPYTKW